MFGRGFWPAAVSSASRAVNGMTIRKYRVASCSSRKRNHSDLFVESRIRLGSSERAIEALPSFNDRLTPDDFVHRQFRRYPRPAGIGPAIIVVQVDQHAHPLCFDQD